MIVIIIICIVLSALFSSSETAFASVNKIRLKSMADQGDKRALKALHIAEHYEDSLTAILVGNNIVNIGASLWRRLSLPSGSAVLAQQFPPLQ